MTGYYVVDDDGVSIRGCKHSHSLAEWLALSPIQSTRKTMESSKTDLNYVDTATNDWSRVQSLHPFHTKLYYEHNRLGLKIWSSWITHHTPPSSSVKCTLSLFHTTYWELWGRLWGWISNQIAFCCSTPPHLLFICFRRWRGASIYDEHLPPSTLLFRIPCSSL